MGQAKQRGTFEERKVMAIERNRLVAIERKKKVPVLTREQQVRRIESMQRLMAFACGDNTMFYNMKRR